MRATAADVLDVRRLNRALLARQLLLARHELPAARAIERVGGLQAQWPKPPFVALWSRLAGFTREELARAIAKRQVVRATLMRGTLHMVSAKDYAKLRGALVPALDRALAGVLRDRLKKLDLDAVDDEARAFFRAPRTFDALREHLAEAHPKGDVRAMAYAARMRLPLVQVPSADQPWGYSAAPDFALAPALLGARFAFGSPDARALVTRHLAAFGPATAADVQAWSGAPTARATLEQMRGELTVLRDARGREIFDLPDAPRPPADAPAPARLLPEFDGALLAHADRARIVADAHRRAIVTPNLLVRATLLVDGFVAGTWKIDRKKDAATLTMTPFAALAKSAARELTDEAERLVRFAEPDARAFAVALAR